MTFIDARSQKALVLAAGAATWTRLPSGAFRVPSCSAPDHSYVVSPQTCTCPDSEHNPERLCKHSIACSLVLALMATAEPEPARVKMTDAEMAGARLGSGARPRLSSR